MTDGPSLAVAISEAPPVERWRPSDATWAVVGTVVAAAAAFALVAALRPGTRIPPIFEHLMARDEPAAAVLSCMLVLVAVLWARRSRLLPVMRLIDALGSRPQLFVVCATAVFAAASVLVYRTHPLSMDEYAPVFQAGAFAHGHLTGKVPPQFLPRLVSHTPWFLESSPSGEMFSIYWPGFALLLTPFTLLGCPWLLNPLVGGATLLVMWHIARTLWPGSAAPALAVLFAAASPAFVVNAISFYSMPAHLLASMVYVALLLQPTPRRLLLAGLVGGFALSLHNPFPHTLFALPWIIWIWRKGGVAALARLATGYLPGTLLLVVGWAWLRWRLSSGMHGVHPVEVARAFLRLPFAEPSAHFLWSRAAALVELSLWTAPAVLVLAWIGWRRLRRGSPVAGLLAASAFLTISAYFAVPFDQGHGWGHRYFHSAWGVLPLLAAGLLGSPNADAYVRRLAVLAAIGSLLFGNLLRFAQVRSFIDGQLAQLPAVAASAAQQLVLVRPDRGYYTVDLVQNDPFFRNRRWMLLSVDPVMDGMFLDSTFSSARLLGENDVASVWEVVP